MPNDETSLWIKPRMKRGCVNLKYYCSTIYYVAIYTKVQCRFITTMLGLLKFPLYYTEVSIFFHNSEEKEDHSSDHY